MKIIAGSLRGINVPTIRNAKYKPTTSKFREALFSILTSGDFAYLMEGASVLDLFSGSGILGFEALSRGANHVTFVDIESRHIELVKIFAEKYSLVKNVNFIQCDAIKLDQYFASRRVNQIKYDLVFIDPPYGFGMVDKSLSMLLKAAILNDQAIIVIETASKEDIVIPKECYFIEERKYGGSKMTLVKYLDHAIKD